MKKRRGEITTQQIVLLLILLVSFIVILFLLFRLDLFGQSDSEICHNSVVMRGNPVSKEALPLKCSRTYVCITKDGDCEAMTKPEIERVKTKDEIYHVLAEEMANCWWMFGEGEVNYVTDTMVKNNYCSICTQIFFDNSLSEIEGIDEEISKDELYDYLAKTKMPDEDITYAYYLLGTNDVSRIKSRLSSQASEEVSFGTIKVGEQYFVVTGITSQVKTLTWVLGGALAGGIGAASVVSGAFIPVLVGVVVGGGAGGVGGLKISDLLNPEIAAITIEGKGVKNNFMVPTIQEANSDEFKLLNCEEILTTT